MALFNSEAVTAERHTAHLSKTTGHITNLSFPMITLLSNRCALLIDCCRKIYSLLSASTGRSGVWLAQTSSCPRVIKARADTCWHRNLNSGTVRPVKGGLHTNVGNIGLFLMNRTLTTHLHTVTRNPDIYTVGSGMRKFALSSTTTTAQQSHFSDTQHSLQIKPKMAKHKQTSRKRPEDHCVGVCEYLSACLCVFPWTQTGTAAVFGFRYCSPHGRLLTWKRKHIDEHTRTHTHIVEDLGTYPVWERAWLLRTAASMQAQTHTRITYTQTTLSKLSILNEILTITAHLFLSTSKPWTPWKPKKS